MAKATGTSTRPRLTRARVLEEAVRLVDERGVDALTMRALGQRLGVEAMSLYGHVAGKGGLRNGIVELLWQEVEQEFRPGEGWQETMRSLARSLRALGTRHPNCFPLVIGSNSLFEPVLRIYERAQATLCEAGFEPDRATKAVNAVMGHAMGYAAMELSCFVTRPDREEPELDAVVRITRALPSKAPPELVRVARDSLFDSDEQFEFGLDALLAGLAR